MLEVGNTVPVFSLINQNGSKVSLSDYRGQKVIVYFYPKDHTPGCTRQACAFRDNYEEFKKNNAVVIGISKDDTKSHSSFMNDYELPFILLSDPDFTVANVFGVVAEKSMFGKPYLGMNRSTFIIDEYGVIIKVFEKADPDNNAQEILDFLQK